MPFLMYWQEFENVGFNVIETLRTIILKEFSEYILASNVKADHLMLIITERFSDEVLGYFDYYKRFGRFPGHDKEHNQEYSKKYFELQISDRIVNYESRILNMREELLSKQHAVVKNRIKDTS